MPTYVNIGARLGAGTMVDTWATVGSCAQIGTNVHLSGGVGIGGVLEPAQAAPVVVEDEAMVGSRCMVTQGARIGRGSVLGEGVILNPSIPVIDAETGDEISRGVVPPNGSQGARIEGGTLWGLGATDMKGGLAVLCELAVTERDLAVDVTYVLYECEEVDQRHNGLARLGNERPDLLRGDAAILAEPTGGQVEAGCQGTLRAVVAVTGERAHTARPWMGVNAVHRLAPVLSAVAGYQERRPVIDGCEYRESLQAVGVDGGVAGNVVPDRARLVLNHRFAPDRDADGALASLGDLLGPALDTAAGDTIEVESVSHPAPPALDHPLLAGLVEGSGAAPRAKLGWTDVAFFSALGVPATNFGPGDPELAHTAGERV